MVLIGLLFSLERHSKPITHAISNERYESFSFTLSLTKFYSINVFNLNVLADVEINTEFGSNPNSIFPDSSEFKHFLVYFEESDRYDDQTALTNIIGGFLIATEYRIKSFRFDSLFSKLYMDVKISDADGPIQDMALITENHLLVGFKRNSYLHIYNIHSGELVEKKELNGSVVKCFVCNSHKNIINHVAKFKNNTIFAAVAYNTGSV